MPGPSEPCEQRRNGLPKLQGTSAGPDSQEIQFSQHKCGVVSTESRLQPVARPAKPRPPCIRSRCRLKAGTPYQDRRPLLNNYSPLGEKAGMRGEAQRLA